MPVQENIRILGDIFAMPTTIEIALVRPDKEKWATE